MHSLLGFGARLPAVGWHHPDFTLLVVLVDGTTSIFFAVNSLQGVVHAHNG